MSSGSLGVWSRWYTTTVPDTRLPTRLPDTRVRPGSSPGSPGNGFKVARLGLWVEKREPVADFAAGASDDRFGVTLHNIRVYRDAGAATARPGRCNGLLAVALQLFWLLCCLLF